MGRKKNSPAATAPVGTHRIDEATEAQFREMLSGLGAERLFCSIQRRIPGQPIWEPLGGKIALDRIDSFQEYCSTVGGEEYEYRIYVVTGDGRRVAGPGGAILEPRYVPALKKRETPAAPEKDPDLAEREKEIERRRKEIDLRKRERRLQEEEERLLRDEGDDVDDGGGEIVYDPRLDPRSPYFSPSYFQQIAAQNPALAGTFAPQKQGKSELVALIEAQSAQTNAILTTLTASLGGGKTDSLDQLLKMKALFPQTDLKDITAQMSGAYGSMLQTFMAGQTEQQSAINKKIIELAIMGGADDDDVEKIKKILGLVGDTVKDTVIPFFKGVSDGRKGNKVEVPSIAGKAADKKKPAPNDKAPQTGSSAKTGEGGTSPAARAMQVVKERVSLFLKVHEEEMLVGSEPGFAAEKLDDLWIAFPGILRRKLEGFGAEENGVRKIYEALNQYDADTVASILGAVVEDAKVNGGMKEWCCEFWAAVFEGPDEEEDPGEGDDEGGEDKPETPDDGGGGEDEKEPEEEKKAETATAEK